MKSALILFALAPLAFAAGPLTPPGAPAPTMKSLDEVEPRTPLTQSDTPGDATAVFKITQPGSYYLAGNIKPPAGKNGILIALLVPGVVEVDMGGFTMDGSEAGASASGIVCSAASAFENRRDGLLVHGGTIRNFAGDSCLFPTAITMGTLELRDMRIIGGGAGVSTEARLLLSRVSISGGSGTAVHMGSDSVLSGVELSYTNSAGAVPPAAITGSGDHHALERVALSYSFGATNSGSMVVLGPNSRVSGITARITGGSFSAPIFRNSSGFSEVSGLTQELTDCTAPAAVSNWATFPSSLEMQDYDEVKNSGDAGGLASRAGIPKITARNCTFTQAVMNIDFPLAAIIAHEAEEAFIGLEGTSTTPTVVRTTGDGITVSARIFIAPTANVTGAVINVSGNGNTVSSSIRGLPSGGTGILISSGRSTRVTGCSISGRNDGPATAIKIAPGVTNVLCTNENITELAVGSTVVDNLGGSSNAIAPILTTPASIAANTNPFAIIVH